MLTQAAEYLKKLKAHIIVFQSNFFVYFVYIKIYYNLFLCHYNQHKNKIFNRFFSPYNRLFYDHKIKINR